MSYADQFKKMGKGFDFAQALAEADRCLLCHDPPCSKGCPAETDPGTFIRKLRLRNVTGAIRTIKQNNALGGACGVLCPTPRLCEKECSATGIGRPIEIGKIQRFLVEHGWSIGFQAYEKPAPQVGEGGRGRLRAGGACPAPRSWREQGVQVTVFEERAEPGGVIRYGVPAYRFDKAFLKNELQDLKDLGVKFKCNTRVEGAEGAQKLLDSGFRAVFLAPGLWGAERLPAKGKAKGVYTSVDFLASAARGALRGAGQAGQGQGRGRDRRRQRGHGLRGVRPQAGRPRCLPGVPPLLRPDACRAGRAPGGPEPGRALPAAQPAHRLPHRRLRAGQGTAPAAHAPRGTGRLRPAQTGARSRVPPGPWRSPW